MKKLQITRSSPNYEELVELYKAEKNAKQKVRYHALVLMHEVKNCSKVAEIIKMSDRSVQLWVKSFNIDGLKGIALNSPPGRPSSLSQDQLEELKRDVLTHPRELDYEFSNWDGKSVSEYIKKKFGVDLKVRRCQYILHELGLTLQRPRYDFPKADPEEQEKFIEDFKKNSLPLGQTA
ncbi:MAG: helix-turn-helix domain-containing protein [Promethearchaeota archaeon]